MIIVEDNTAYNGHKKHNIPQRYETISRGQQVYSGNVYPQYCDAGKRL
jgi:hypothetical protein